MIEDFRDGLLSLNTRQFGKVAELIVQLLQDYGDSNKLEFDLLSLDTGEKIEVKASRVYKKQALDLSLDSLYDTIINNSNRNRLLKQKQAPKAKFDCNIQQIKRQYFDKLYYLLLFYDKIEIFSISPNDIVADTKIGYSDKQHRGNVGEGQFHITAQNYSHHKAHYLIESVSYAQLKKMLLQRKKAASQSK